MAMNSLELRKCFLDFFRRHNHTVIKSAPLIPQDDPTLLFVNAGMVQFKNVFTQKEKRPYKRACSSQKCVRAGGKHNDLENVGKTARHHTFFEMLGNFSFGDYFKEEAISFAWKFLTEELKLDTSRLSVSVFAGDENVPGDLEAFDIWHKKIGLPIAKIKKLGKADNFWQMGETGPCGPCTEIHFDRSDIKIGFGDEDNGDKNIEIWNLVFMQYEMFADGSLKPLPAPCVDTGMGLERLAAVVNNLRSNYDTDLLRPLIKKTEQLSHKTYHAGSGNDDIAMRVIADHARATAFLIADGLFPSNEGRGYVLRRFMRRAIRHGSQLGLKDPFFHDVCLEVASLMGEPYPELLEAKPLIEKVVMQEEEAFRKTLDRGLSLFSSQTKNCKKGDHLGGDVVFRLYETFGFPPDLTEDLAKERGLLIDWAKFDKAQKEHEERSAQGLHLKGVEDVYLDIVERHKKTIFYDDKEMKNLKTIALIKDNKEITSLRTGEVGAVLLDRTPFYGESGGQIGDTGMLFDNETKARVVDTKKIAGLHVHMVKVDEGTISLNQALNGAIDWSRRQEIRRNHSATHLLHSALRTILGNHVTQKGSLVEPDRLRFDFSHFAALTKEEIIKVEDLVNVWILENEEAKLQTMTIEEAKAYGALALFGEKYDEKVRVLEMGSHSTELCGGTHCHRTGDIGSFRILSEAPLAQGIRRIEAISGIKAVEHSRASDSLLKELSQKLGVKGHDLSDRIDTILKELKESERAQKQKTTGTLKEHADIAATKAQTLGSVKFVNQVVNAFITDPADLRLYADLIRDRIQNGIVALGFTDENKCTLLVACTADLAKKIHAGKVVQEIAPLIGGKGGGRPDFAQAGGDNKKELPQALSKVAEIIARELRSLD